MKQTGSEPLYGFKNSCSEIRDSAEIEKSVTVHSILKSLRLPERQTWGALAPSQERATPLCLENHSPLLLVSLYAKQAALSGKRRELTAAAATKNIFPFL